MGRAPTPKVQLQGTLCSHCALLILPVSTYCVLGTWPCPGRTAWAKAVPCWQVCTCTSLGLPAPGRQAMFVVILISILTHISPRFTQMNLIKSLSLIFYILQNVHRETVKEQYDEHLDTHHLDLKINSVLCTCITHCLLSSPPVLYFGKLKMVLLVIH